MIRASSRRHSSAPFLLRRLSTSNDFARHRAAQINRTVYKSLPRDAASAHRNPTTELITSATTCHRGAQLLANRPPPPKSP